jgi:hypothetical protein
MTPTSSDAANDSGITNTNPWQKRVWIVLSLVGGIAFAVLVIVWSLKQPSKDTLWCEVVTTCLQVIGVAVFGGIVALAINNWQEERRQTADRLERQRVSENEKAQLREERAARVLEEYRRQFQLRTSLLDRAVQCAQKMYVNRQHIRRLQKDISKRQPMTDVSGRLTELEQKTIDALLNFDQIYLEFSAEAASLEIELGARYGIPPEYDSGEDSRSDLSCIGLVTTVGEVVEEGSGRRRGCAVER